MKTKTLNLLLCLIAVTSSMLISCSEDLGFGNKIEQDEAKLVSVAKQIYQNQGSTVCLPNSNADKTTASRSSFSYLADLEPLWDETFTYQQGNETIVIVPLKCDEDIRSTLSITDGEETSYQFAKVFSRMIVKPSEGENGIYVLSYMPESSYASTFDDIEQEMRYNPTELDFTGLIVSSRLNGEVMKGFLYSEGVLGHYFAPATPECRDHNCTENHNHNHEHKGLSLSFNLQNANQSRSTTYSTRSEDYMCPNCHKIGYCECYNGSLFEYCEKCNNWKFNCICEDDKGPCPNCGISDGGCGCSQCSICGRYFCVCNNPTPPPAQELCEVCEEYYCICEKNTTPIEYKFHHKDFLILPGVYFCIENMYNCSFLSALETACYILDSTLTQDDLYFYYIQTYQTTPNENIEFNKDSDFIKNNFDVFTSANIKNSVAAGYPVIVKFSNSYITVFGIQYDGDLIYAHHNDYKIYVVQKDYFNNYDNLAIQNVLLVDSN